MPTTDPCSELSKVITDLAMMIGERPGMDTLDKVTAELQKHIPEITRDDLVNSIVEATTTHREALDETRAQIAALKREARGDAAARRRIVELERHLGAGTRPEGGPRPETAPEALRLLREIRDDLRKRVGPTEHARAGAERRSVDALEQQIDTLERHLEDGTIPRGTPRADNATERVRELREQRDALKAEVRQSVPARRERLIETIDRLTEKLEAVGSVPAVARADLPMTKELDRLAYQRDRLRRQIRERTAALRPKSYWQRAAEPVNFSRSVMTSLDFSAVLRQGAPIALGHPIRGARALRPMFQAAKSEEAAHRIHEEIVNRPNAPLYARYGLYIAEHNEGPLTRREEAFMSRWADKVPLVSGSQRAYVTYLNRLRADSFDALVETLPVIPGDPTATEGQAIANQINIFTGRGKLGKLGDQAAVPLATVFFSPRLVASRFQMVLGQPFYGGNARTRTYIAGEYGRFLAGLGVIYLLAGLAGADFEWDPRSSDFGKIRFGNTRIDPLAGLSQVTVLMAREATGEKVTGSGKVLPLSGEEVPYGGDTRVSIIGRFLRTKLSPVFGSALNMLDRENVVGEPVTIPGEAVRMVVPLAYRDIYEAMQEHGIVGGTALGILSIFGMGVQVYEDREDSSRRTRERRERR